ncbi:hypothetical protein N6H14_14010 [Paenibacillus sp. CC-CFT747]|nr:hypothetical protein N6H14_14010 [Paenibacillus sp. CC-CFT747]
MSHEQLAKALGISKADLTKELKTGKSLADIAKAKGMSEEQLIAKLKEELTPALKNSWSVSRTSGKRRKPSNSSSSAALPEFRNDSPGKGISPLQARKDLIATINVEDEVLFLEKALPIPEWGSIISN